LIDPFPLKILDFILRNGHQIAISLDLRYMEYIKHYTNSVFDGQADFHYALGMNV